MVVCKFFQQGNCRFGQSCRFDHIYGSKYSYHAASAAQPSLSGVTDEQLINQVESDAKAALNGGQWLLSCYSPFKEIPNFPGISDLSPEEARLFIYEAKANNNIDQAVTYMNTQFTEARQKYEQLAQPTLAIINVLKSLSKGESTASPFTTGQNSGFGTNRAATSVFRSAVQGTSVFGQNRSSSSSSIFGQNTANTNQSTQSIFGQSQPTATPSVFSQSPNQGLGQNSVFGSPTDSAKSIFAQATQNVFGASAQTQGTNVFGSSASATQPTQSVFGPRTPNNLFASTNPDPAKSIFAQASQSVFSQQAQPLNNDASIFNTAAESTFGKTNDTFIQQNAARPVQNVFQMQSSETNVYSDMKDLSSEDMKAFKADNFKLGFIPEVAPPRSLCF